MLHICLTIDNNYVHLAELCINQICLTKKPDTEITFHILGYHVNDFSSFLAFEQYPGVHTWCLNYNELDTRLPIDVQSCPHLTNTCWLRYFIPELEMFRDVDRVLYLDADTIVKKDLTELYHYDIKGAPLGVVKYTGGFKFFQVDLKTYKGFNTGVMVMDLPKLRSINWTQKNIELTLKHPTDDQGVMNTWMRNIVSFLPPWYNFSYHYVKMYREYQDIKKWNVLYQLYFKHLDSLVERAVIWHFHGNKTRQKQHPVIARVYEDLEQNLARFNREGVLSS